MDEGAVKERQRIAFGKAVKLHRLRNEKSQFDVGIGHSGGRSAMYKYEYGLRAPNLNTMWNLADAIGEPLWEVLRTAGMFFHGAPELERELEQLDAERPIGRPAKP